MSKKITADWVFLIESAVQATTHSYAPYSRFNVGSILVSEKGNIYRGANIENASFSVTLCAERVALAQMVFSGERKIKKIVVATYDSVPVFPCGVCLQSLAEFSPDAEVLAYSIKTKKSSLQKFSDLFPNPFLKVRPRK